MKLLLRSGSENVLHVKFINKNFAGNDFNFQ